MTRIFHPYYKWEDFKHNFHGGESLTKHEEPVKLCADLLKELHKFELALKVITSEWHYSCQHNLTNESMNRIAYLGQAACALLYEIPASISMGAYSTLTEAEQKSADELADLYLQRWIKQHESTKKVQ